MTLKDFLFKDEAVEGIKSPFEYLYIKLLRLTLLIISSWPQKGVGEHVPFIQKKILKYVYLGVTGIGEILAIYYLKIHRKDLTFLELGHLYICVLMIVVNFSRVVTLTLSKKYHDIAEEFLNKFHLFYYKDRSDYAMETHKMVHFVSHLFTLYLLCLMMGGLFLFNLIPMYSNYATGKLQEGYKTGVLKNSSFEHSLYFAYPFNMASDFRGYIVANIFHWCLSYLTASWFCIFDLMLSLMVFHLWGHFKILINMLYDFPRPSSNAHLTLENGSVVRAEKFSKEELVQVAERIKFCITYHLEIVHFTDTMSDVFGPMLFIYYIFHQTSGCLLLLECSQMTAAALMRYVPLTIILTQQLIQLSVIFELVGSESEKLKDAVYSLPWECMDTANRKSVIIFLMNVQEPVHIKALGVANVGVTSMAAILKTSMSYFTFLNSM